jgi:uncharacterized protein (DUF2336 family)
MSETAMNLQEIDAAVAHASPARRTAMLGQLTSLFIKHADQYSDAEIGLFDDVIARLAAEIEVEARILLSVQLAPVRNAPPRVVRMLAFDEVVEVAAPVLRLSDRLDETTLIENASSKSQAHLLAISCRKSLGEGLTDVLVRRGDRVVAVSVAANPGARLSDAGTLILIKRSAGDDELAERIGARQEIPPHLYLKLLAIASERVRAKLRARHPQAGTEIDRVVAQVAGRMRARAAPIRRDYSATVADVGARHRAKAMSEADVTAYAQAGRFEETVAAFALVARVPLEVVDRAMTGERSDLVLIIARAAGLQWASVKALLRLRAGPKGISASELEQDLASFEQVNPTTAEHILRLHCTGMLRPAQKPS